MEKIRIDYDSSMHFGISEDVKSNWGVDNIIAEVKKETADRWLKLISEYYIMQKELEKTFWDAHYEKYHANSD